MNCPPDFDQRYELLNPSEFHTLKEKLSEELPKLSPCSEVYSRSLKQDLRSPDIRLCSRVTGNREDVFQFIENILMPLLLPGMATAVCRSHYDVIQYNVGEYFGLHRDFERVRGAAIQYFALFSIADADCKGGETGVTDNDGITHWLDAATKPNGALVCRGDLRHQGASVTGGQKTVLKFDFILIMRTLASVVDTHQIQMHLANGSLSVDNRLIQLVPFFSAADRFRVITGASDELNFSQISKNEVEDLQTYMDGSRSVTPLLLKIADALCLEECILKDTEFIRFASGSPVFVDEETASLLWGHIDSRLISFLALVEYITDDDTDGKTAPMMSSSRLVLKDGRICQHLHQGRDYTTTDIKSLNSEAIRLFGGYTSSFEMAAEACRVLSSDAVRASKTLSAIPKAEEPAIFSTPTTTEGEALLHIAPLILGMLSMSGKEAVKVSYTVREEECCNDGDVDVYWLHETLHICHYYGVFRL
jgi:hypothetical protein